MKLKTGHQWRRSIKPKALKRSIKSIPLARLIKKKREKIQLTSERKEGASLLIPWALEG